VSTTALDSQCVIRRRLGNCGSHLKRFVVAEPNGLAVGVDELRIKLTGRTESNSRK